MFLGTANTENSKNIPRKENFFKEKKLRGLSPNSYIHATVSDLYIRSQTHECGNWD
jgi:hypothetical protein